MSAPIRMRCEGSRQPCHGAGAGGGGPMGFCAMCGQVVHHDQYGKALPHDRADIVAMIERGDFDG